MKWLMPAQKKALRMESSKKMIDPCQPLRHPVVIGVFCLEGEFEQTVSHCCCKGTSIAADAAVGTDSSQRRIAVSDKLHADVVGHCRLRRPKHGAHKIVVEKGRAHRELVLLKGEDAEVVPG